MRKNPLPDLGDVIFLLVLQLLLGALPHFLFGDGSTGWHLFTGQYILQTQSIPHQDIMSYTKPGEPWVAYEWLFDTIVASLDRIGGLNAVAVFCSTLIASVMLLLYERCRKVGLNFSTAIVVTVCGALASSLHWLARPHIFTFLGVYIFSTRLESFRRGEISRRHLIAALALSMALWVNLHPGFLLGFALIIIYLACDLLSALGIADDTARTNHLMRCKCYGAGLAAVFAATLLNPYGVSIYSYIAHYLKGSTVLAATDEFSSPIFHNSLQSSCLELIFLLVVLGLAMTRKRPSLPHLMTCLAFAHLALSANRNIPLFVIVALPFIADLFSQVRLPFTAADCEEQPADWFQAIGRRWRAASASFDQSESLSQMHLLPICTVLILFFTSAHSGTLFGNQILKSGFDKKSMPTRTIDYIIAQKLPANKGFNYDNWGGYIRWRAGIPVFIDDRADFYGEKFYFDYGKVSQVNPGWEDVLNSHNIDWILFPQKSRLAAVLKQHPDWQLVCEDEAAKLFLRKQ